MEDIEAEKIITWRYEEPFSIYNIEFSEENLEELVNGTYYSVHGSNKLIGYFCFGEAAQVPAGKQLGVYNSKDFTDIGLGMRPDLCGQKLGYSFLREGLKFARSQLSANNFRLTVAAFNQRAIKVYRRSGFEKVTSFERIADKKKITFEVMIRKNEDQYF